MGRARAGGPGRRTAKEDGGVAISVDDVEEFQLLSLLLLLPLVVTGQDQRGMLVAGKKGSQVKDAEEEEEGDGKGVGAICVTLGC